MAVDSSTEGSLGARSLPEAMASVVATQALADPAAVDRAAPLAIGPGMLGADKDTPVGAGRGKGMDKDRGKAGRAEAADSHSRAVVPIQVDRPCRAVESQDQPSRADSPGASADLRVVAGSSVRSEVLS